MGRCTTSAHLQLTVNITITEALAWYLYIPKRLLYVQEMKFTIDPAGAGYNINPGGMELRYIRITVPVPVPFYCTFSYFPMRSVCPC